MQHKTVRNVFLALLTVAVLGGLPVFAEHEISPTIKRFSDDFYNHYKCYNVVFSLTTAPMNVTLRDQFGFTAGRALRPVKLCNPVSKNNETVPHPENHLVCYDINVLATPGTKKVMVSNQFGNAKLVVETPELLCLPSTKIELPDDEPIE